MQLEDGVIKDISFQGSGCAISKASASMMTAELKGKTEARPTSCLKTSIKMLTGEAGERRRQRAGRQIGDSFGRLQISRAG